MIVGRDFFHYLGVPAPHMADTTLTATKSDNPVIDLRAPDERPGTVVGFIAYVRAQTSLDGSNSMRFEVWEADDKSSGTALDASAAKADADDLIGVVQDDTLLAAEDPVTNVPLFNAASMVGSAFFWMYRGYKNCIQVRPTVVLGSPSFNASIIRVHYSQDMRNLLPSVAQ